MDEATFYSEVVARDRLRPAARRRQPLRERRQRGASIPLAVLADYPLERVGMVHVAGGVCEDGFYFDTHAHPVPPRSCSQLVARDARHVPVMIERDADFDFDAACARAG